MTDGIQAEAERRGITRLCHFTPTKNLVHILTGDQGLVPRARLEADASNPFSPTDPERFDGYLGHHACTVEYPNLWYFDKAKSRDVIFRDWVLLLIKRDYLWSPGTRFCPHNAALHGGRDVAEGDAAFRAMFAASITGSGGVTRQRSARHLPCSPTDDQAEMLVPGIVPLSDVMGMVVPSTESAEEHWARMVLLGTTDLAIPFVVAPVLFDKYALRSAIVAGKRPEEVLWHPTK